MLRQLQWMCIFYLLQPIIAYEHGVQPDFDICDREQCKVVENVFQNNMNLDAVPCDDFYEYACNRPDRSELSRILQSNIGLEEFLSDSTINEYSIKPLDVEREIFRSCDRAYTLSARRSYEELLLTNGANRLNSNYRSIETNWYEKEINYATSGFGFAFFEVNIVEEDSQRYIQLSPTSDNFMNINDLLTMEYMQTSDYREDKYDKLKELINELIRLPHQRNYDTNRRSQTKTIRQWQQEYDSIGGFKIAWKQLLNSLFSVVISSSIPIQDDTHIIVKDETYFNNLAKMLPNFPMNTIVDYVHLRFVSKTIGLVERKYQEKYSMIPLVKGLKCTPGLMVGAAHVYINKYFPKDNKETVEEIFHQVKLSISKLFIRPDIDYKEESSRISDNFARELMNSNIFIGYPDWLANETIISKFYGPSFEVSDAYHLNQMKMILLLLKNQLRSLYDKSLPIFDLRSFFRTFTQEKIEISNNLKEIVLPARAFSENNYKFLSAQLFAPINYGAAASDIAAELYLKWLYKIRDSENATRCAVKQMPFHFDKTTNDHYLMIATAYLLGLATAYEIWPTKNFYPIEFPEFGALPDFQIFFLSFAETVCRDETEKDFKRYMVNLAVSNTKEFLQAFNCHEKHKLYTTDFCDPLQDLNIRPII